MVVAIAPAQVLRTVSLDAASIADINAAFDAGTLTFAELVRMCLARNRAYDREG